MKNPYNNLTYAQNFLLEVLIGSTSPSRIQLFQSLINFANEKNLHAEDTADSSKNPGSLAASDLPVSLKTICDSFSFGKLPPNEKNSQERKDTENRIWHDCLFFSYRDALLSCRSLHYRNPQFAFQTHVLVNTSPEEPMYGNQTFKTVFEQLLEYNQQQLLAARNDAQYGQKSLQELASPSIRKINDLPIHCLSLDRQLRQFYLLPPTDIFFDKHQENTMGFMADLPENQIMPTEKEWLLIATDSSNQVIHHFLVLPLVDAGLRNGSIICLPAAKFIDRFKKKEGIDLNADKAALYDLLYINRPELLKERCQKMGEKLTTDFLHLKVKKREQNPIGFLKAALQQRQAQENKTSPQVTNLSFIAEYLRLKEWLEMGAPQTAPLPTITHTPAISSAKTGAAPIAPHADAISTTTDTPASLPSVVLPETETKTDTEIETEIDTETKTEIDTETKTDKKNCGKDIHLLVNFLNNYSSVYRLSRTELLLDKAFNKYESEVLICLVPFIENEHLLDYYRSSAKTSHVYLLYNDTKNVVQAFENALEKAKTEKDYRDFYVMEYLYYGAKKNRTLKLPKQYVNSLEQYSQKIFKDKLKSEYQRKNPSSRKKISKQMYYELIQENIFGIMS